MQSELKELNKIHVVIQNLHEIKKELLLNFTAELELVGQLSIADHIPQTHIRFRKITDYESYINAINQDYESEDVIFKGYNYKINTPQFNLVNRSQYRKGCDFKQEIIEYRGNYCFITTKGYCFVKRNIFINFITRAHYKQQYLGFFPKRKKTI